MRFPSREWFEAAAAALASDPGVVAAVADFGPVTAGTVIGRGAGLSEDFCVLARIEPAKQAQLRYPEDEDELEDLEPDYICWIPYELCRSMLRAALEGAHPDPMKAILSGRMKLKGDLQRVVKQAGRHRGAGVETLRALPTEFV
jgi:hypothetical protein